MGLVSKITEAVIYESPDGGETIYVRKSGEPPNMRQLHSESDVAMALRKKVHDEELWSNIRLAAKSNPTLQRALDEAIMIYNLSK
jgi:hypothetical protein